MTTIEKLNALHSLPVGEPKLAGCQSFRKVFATDGTPAFFSVSDLDLDTDGQADPNIRYESTNQGETTIDPGGKWCNSNKLNFIVLPIGFKERRGGVKLGCLATVVYKNKVAHAIFADEGPKTKYGEGSIALHRALGFERVKNGKIVDVGIDPPVGILIYIGSNIGKTPVIQADIDKACAPLWAKFSG